MTLVIIWGDSKQDKVYRPRVERLLNAALSFPWLESVVHYLFLILRLGLRSSGDWSDATAKALARQFFHLFRWNVCVASDEDACECIWAGDDLDIRECAPSCQSLLCHVGVVKKGPGLRYLVEQLEKRSWLLGLGNDSIQLSSRPGEGLRGEGFRGCKKRVMKREGSRGSRRKDNNCDI